MKFPCLLFVIGTLSYGGTVIDQIAVVVGKHPIKTSDISRDVRVTQFLNGDAAEDGLSERRASVQRLIDQELIRADMAQSGNTAPLEADAQDVLNRLVKDRFHGSQSEMNAELKRRGLSVAQLSDELQWQFVVLRFIDRRFRPSVTVSEDDIRAYFEQHSADLKKQYPGSGTLEQLTPAIRDSMEGERINRNFEDWLAEARKGTSIDFKFAELSPQQLKAEGTK